MSTQRTAAGDIVQMHHRMLILRSDSQERVTRSTSTNGNQSSNGTRQWTMGRCAMRSRRGHCYRLFMTVHKYVSVNAQFRVMIRMKMRNVARARVSVCACDGAQVCARTPSKFRWNGNRTPIVSIFNQNSYIYLHSGRPVCARALRKRLKTNVYEWAHINSGN